MKTHLNYTFYAFCVIRHYLIFKTYVSVAAGANIIDYKQYYGEFGNINQSNFGFRAEGGLGVVIPFKKQVHRG
jgi:hypothetical protein